MERLQKYLSRAGVASRRHAETMITDGRVKVNGKVVTELGTRVDAQKDLVLLDGKLVSASSERKYFLLYKPPGVVTTLSDPEGRPTVADYAREAGGRVFPVGRLDYDAEGALILTDDGDLANKLMHPSHQVPRVYLAKVKGVPDDASLAKLVEGVRLEDGMAKAVEARIFNHAQRNTWVKLIVTEGRQHLVKRLCAAIGHPVVRLFRPAHAAISVHGLRPGELRELTHDEIRRVKAAADGDVQPQPSLYLPGRRHGHAAPGFEPEDDDEGGEEQAPVPPPAQKSGKFGARDAIAGYEMKPLRPRDPDGTGSRAGGRFGKRGVGASLASSPGAPGGERAHGGSAERDRGPRDGSFTEQDGSDASRRSFGKRQGGGFGTSESDGFGKSEGGEREDDAFGKRGRGGRREGGEREGGLGKREGSAGGKSEGGEREGGGFGKREGGGFGKREGGGFDKSEGGGFGKREGGFGKSEGGAGKREGGGFGKREGGSFGKREGGGFGKREGGSFGKREGGGFGKRQGGFGKSEGGFGKREGGGVGKRLGGFGKREGGFGKREGGGFGKREGGGFGKREGGAFGKREGGGFGKRERGFGKREGGGVGKGEGGGFGKRDGGFGKREGGFGKREGGGVGKREGGAFGKREGGFGKREGGGFGKREGGGFGKREGGSFGKREGGSFGKREGGSFGKPGFAKREGAFGQRDGTADAGGASGGYETRESRSGPPPRVPFTKRTPGAFGSRKRDEPSRGGDERGSGGSRKFGKREGARKFSAGGRKFGGRDAGGGKRFAPKTGGGQRTGARSKPRR